jgi:hypothetical protein
VTLPPQLITAAQDMWHAGSDTWFDRSTDLRVLLNGGAAPAEDPNAKYAEADTPGAAPNITPAVWVRGAGSSLDRDASANVSAYGRDYRYNLDRNLGTVDFQGGIDLGKRGLFSDNDMLVFGALGGFVHSDLDYDAINRLFSFERRPGRRLCYLLKRRAVRRHAPQRAPASSRHQDLGLSQFAQRDDGGRENRFGLPLRLVRP